MSRRAGRIVAVFIMAAMLLTCVSAGADVAFAKGGSKKGISLTPKSVTLKVGDKKKVKVKYSTKKLQKKLKKKPVKWSTSNKKIATVSKGTIKARKAGTVTITAKVGKYKAKVKVRVKKRAGSGSSKYVNATDAYTYLNEFRTKPKQWQWNENGTKEYFNTNSGNTLAPLKRDAALENAAKVRAKEIASKFSHTRPNGQSCFTAYPSGLSYKGENIAYGFTSAWNVTSAWIEEDMSYAKQGHRRNMLNKNFNCVGIAGYKSGGTIYWVQCFGKR